MADILGKEVVSAFDFNQFQPHESVDQCGPAAVALIHFCGQVGKGPQGNPSDAIGLMEQLYSKYIGPDVPDDHGGTSLITLYNMIMDVGNHFQNLYPDGGIPGNDEKFGCPQWSLKEEIRRWAEIGYPVIIAVTEDSVFDMGLKKKPYGWNTAGLTHILTVTGVSASGIDLLVRDTANVLAPGPRMYAVTPLQIISATVVVPGRTLWLPRPKSIHAADMEAAPVQVQPKPVVVPAPPAPAPAPVQSAADLQATLQDLHAQALAIQAQLSKIVDESASATPTVV